MQIFAKMPSGRTITVQCEPTDSVYSVKETIDRKEAVTPDMQRLIYGGRQLQDEKQLMDYNVQSETTVTVLFRLPTTITVIAISVDGRHHKIATKETDTVQTLMQKIADKTGIAVGNQRILSKGNDLWKTPDATLGSFAIGDGTTVHVMEAMEPCSCCV